MGCPSEFNFGPQTPNPWRLPWGIGMGSQFVGMRGRSGGMGDASPSPCLTSATRIEARLGLGPGTANREVGALVVEEAGVGLVEEVGSTRASELFVHAAATATTAVAVDVGAIDAADVHIRGSNRGLVFEASTQQMRSSSEEASVAQSWQLWS